MKFEAANDVDSADFLDANGTYHFLVEHIHENENAKGEVYDGLQVACSVLAGTEKGQEKKLFTARLRDGQASDSDGGTFSRKVQTAFCLAVDLITPADLGKSLEFDVEAAIGAQFIATVKKNKNGYLDVQGASIYHVDDPRAEALPKEKDSLALIEKGRRHAKEYFAPLLGSKAKPKGKSMDKGDINDLL